MTSVERPEVTVIVTTYNSEPYIAAALNSVMRQTFEDWELLLVDDASQDRTLEIARQTAGGDRRVQYRALERNSGGPAAPRNLGVSVARGRWIAFLDADDIWMPYKLEWQLKELARTGARFISSRRRSFRLDAEIRDACEPRGERQRVGARLTYRRLTLKNWICTSSALGEAELFRRARFPEDLQLKAVEDYWCWLRVHEETKWSWLTHEPLVNYRLAVTSISRGRGDMIRKHWRLYGAYFGAGWRGELLRGRSMATYAFASVWRLLRERTVGIR